MPTTFPHYTTDIGSAARPGAYITGPVLLTYLHPEAVVQVLVPSTCAEESSLVTEIRGANFRGAFFADHGWNIKAVTARALLTFQDLRPDLTDIEGVPQTTPNAVFTYRSLGMSDLRVAGKLRRTAVREVEEQLDCDIELAGDWREDEGGASVQFRVRAENPWIDRGSPTSTGSGKQ